MDRGHAEVVVTTFLDFMAVCGLMLAGAAVVVFLVACYLVAADWVRERRRAREIDQLERAFNDE